MLVLLKDVFMNYNFYGYLPDLPMSQSINPSKKSLVYIILRLCNGLDAPIWAISNNLLTFSGIFLHLYNV